MSRNSLLPTLIWILSLGVSTPLLSQHKTAIVHLKDSSSVKGTLLEMNSANVHIDPEGPISLQVFAAEEIDYIHILDTDNKIKFPLSSTSTALVPQTSKNDQHQRKLTFTRKWSLVGAWGKAGNFFESQGDVDVSDYSTGGILLLGVRYHFLPNSPGGSSSFFEFSYHHTSVSTEISSFDPISFVQSNSKKNVGINNYSLNYGWHTAHIGNNSYLNFIGGISYFSMGGGADIGLANSALGLRFGVGSVVGIQSRYNFLINFLVDITYMGTKKVTTIVGTQEERPKTVGGIYFFNFGLMYDL